MGPEPVEEFTKARNGGPSDRLRLPMHTEASEGGADPFLRLTT